MHAFIRSFIASRPPSQAYITNKYDALFTMASDVRTGIVVVGVSLSQQGGETWRYTITGDKAKEGGWPVLARWDWDMS